MNYEHIKSCYKVIAFDLSVKKEIDPNPKAIQQTEYVSQLKNTNSVNAGGDSAESMFVLTILEKKIKKTRPTFFQGSAFFKDVKL